MIETNTPVFTDEIPGYGGRDGLVIMVLQVNIMTDMEHYQTMHY